MIDERFLVFILFLNALVKDELNEEEKETLKDLLKGWREQYRGYNPDTPQVTLSSVVESYNTLVRNHAQNNCNNAIMAKAIELILDGICKD